MTRSVGGRARQYQRVTRIRPPRAPAAVFGGVIYCETFPTDGPLDSTPEDLTWTVQTGGGLDVVSGRLTSDVNPGGTIARAEHAINGSDFYVEFPWAAVDGLGINAQVDVYLGSGGVGLYAEPYDDELPVYTQIYYDGSSTFVEVHHYWTNDLLSPIEELTTTSPVATWRIEVEGDDARVYRDAVLVCTGTGVDAYRPLGTGAMVEVFNGAEIDDFCYGDL